MATGPREAVYDEHINPLMAQIINICKANGIPFVASFELETDEEEGPLLCSSALVPEGASDKIVRCYNVLRERPITFAMYAYKVDKP